MGSTEALVGQEQPLLPWHVALARAATKSSQDTPSIPPVPMLLLPAGPGEEGGTQGCCPR